MSNLYCNHCSDTQATEDDLQRNPYEMVRQNLDAM